MTNRLVQMQSANLNRSTKAYISNEEFSPSPTPELLDPNAHVLNMEGGDNDYRFSIGKLPTWAKKQVVDDPNSAANAASNKGVDFPKGRTVNY